MVDYELRHPKRLPLPRYPEWTPFTLITDNSEASYDCEGVARHTPPHSYWVIWGWIENQKEWAISYHYKHLVRLRDHIPPTHRAYASTIEDRDRVIARFKDFADTADVLRVL